MWLHKYATLVAASTLLLIAVGGMVTSTGSGLAVPDWPTTYGYFMFTFPVEWMVGGIYWEHGHRLIASTVGLLMIGLCAWIWVGDSRRWLRILGSVALGAVIVQGVLGGITVLYFLPAPISIAHAGLAQIFFCLTVALAVFTSRGWRSGYPTGRHRRRALRDVPADGSVPDDATLRVVTVATTLVIYAQILLGATMRHTGAGLAIPDFPLVYGGLVPPHWTTAIAIHYAHRIGALVAALLILAACGHVFYHHRARRELTRPAVLLLLLVLVQIALGGLTVLSGKAPVLNTAHVATGALVLATSLVLTLRAHRPLAAAKAGASTSLSPHASLKGTRGQGDMGTACSPVPLSLCPQEARVAQRPRSMRA